MIAFLINSSLLWAIRPVKEYIKYPDSSFINCQERMVRTSDSFDVALWDCTSIYDFDTTKPIIIFVEADYGNMSYYLSYIEPMVEAGYRVISFDYRGFGKSSQFEINENMLYYNEYTNDLKSVVDNVKNLYSSDKIVLFGLSMGTIISTLVLNQENLNGLIGEGFIFNPFEICKRVKKIKNKEILLPHDANLYTQFLSNLKCKILIVSGKQDIVTTVEDSQYIKANNPRRQIIEFDGGHLQGMSSLNKKYIDYINKYIGYL